MKVTVFISVLSCCLLGINSLIIPDELPSLLSVIYSNIPTLKKGTDSRLGWGFRLGDRADFQILVELGPQKYTQPLRNQQQTEGNSKRNTLDTLADTLYAQNQELKRLKNQSEKEQFVIDTHKQEKVGKGSNTTNKKSTDPTSNPEAADWLKAWSSAAKEQQRHQHQPAATSSRAQPGLGIGEIDAKSVIPDDEDRPKTVPKETLAERTTSEKDALDNVDLD